MLASRNIYRTVLRARFVPALQVRCQSNATAKATPDDVAELEKPKAAPVPKKRITIPHSKLPRVPAAEFMDHEDFKLQTLFARGGAIYAPELFHVIPQKKLFLEDLYAEAEVLEQEMAGFNEWSAVPAELDEPLVYFEGPDERAARLDTAAPEEETKRGRRKPKSSRFNKD
ncbi:hypothetical protein BABINDRAFT_168797 [Babjeviella inositovora NRRL Y-12698]|uniref:Uncharacterized protein n=1 Tax=Babjeviella inositovora NRRL Y-12698 TaxID=984486 RepID=A0A1E3QJI0_9ASCO|nr:uncharacterized protein BABINDRAFT_168797 [Babjeviella inositovora NRRL Y-12698]ODQ77839.1 hypothetical protein BABINDRAFT_168797 [Babjeviella inositovora NRRL Y-12698]